MVKVKNDIEQPTPIKVQNIPQSVTKQDLIDHMAAEYNALLGKLNIYTGLSQSPEMIRAKSRLEESFLWVRCSLEKMQAPKPEGKE